MYKLFIKDMSWSAEIQMFELSSCQRNGTLSSNESYATINKSQSKVNINNLFMSNTGMYILRALINSSDSSYNLKCYSNAILILAPNTTLSLNDDLDPNVFLSFNENYDSVVSNGLVEHIKAKFYNCIFEKYGLVQTRSITVYKGSVMVNSGISGSAANINQLSSDIINGTFASEFGSTIKSAQIMGKDIIKAPSDQNGDNGSNSASSSVRFFKFNLIDIS